MKIKKWFKEQVEEHQRKERERVADDARLGIRWWEPITLILLFFGMLIIIGSLYWLFCH